MFRSITNCINSIKIYFLLTKLNKEKIILNNKLKEKKTTLNSVTCSSNIKSFIEDFTLKYCSN